MGPFASNSACLPVTVILRIFPHHCVKVRFFRCSSSSNRSALLADEHCQARHSASVVWGEDVVEVGDIGIHDEYFEAAPQLVEHHSKLF